MTDDPKPPADKFRDMARELECDEDEAVFEDRVRKVANTPKPRAGKGPVSVVGREARATALLAGNGLVLLKLFETHWPMLAGGQVLSLGFIVGGLGTFIGMACAYSLFGLARGRTALLAEVYSVGAFASPVLAWFAVSLWRTLAA